jgi:hypothetical protein
MTHELHGTIIMAVKRDDFIVLAADSLCHDRANPTAEANETNSKIVAHLSLPFAVATSGYAYLYQGMVLVNDIIIDLIGYFKSKDDLIIDTVVNWLNFTDRHGIWGC